MNKHFVRCWEENKHKLEDWFANRNLEYVNYATIVEKLFELVLTPETKYRFNSSFDVAKITTIDDGDYQGTMLFLIPEEGYQPNEYAYVITTVDYGSCSGCDTLLRITDYSDGTPNETQLKDLMTIALHLVQSAKYVYEKGE
jgi:hypothetical protein